MPSLTLTLWGHSCVEFTGASGSVLVDPGVFSPDAPLDAATAILITHGHGDHLDAARVAAAHPALGVWGPDDALADLRAAGVPDDRLHPVVPGDALDLAGLRIEVLAMAHAVIHADLPSPTNVGYLVAGSVLHPGDSVAAVDVAVDTLLLPVAAPWLALGDAVDFARALRPRLAIPIHDAILSEAGLSVADGLAGAVLAPAYRRLAIGEPLTVTTEDSA